VLAVLSNIRCEALKPGEAAVIDAGTLGYPANSLKDIPAGDYYVQALLNIYTRFSRADGHVIWAHNDQWEGQQFNRSPGNLFSDSESLKVVVDQLVKAQHGGTELAVVMGGGNILRGRDTRDMDQVAADKAGMLATVINGIKLTELLNANCPACHFSAVCATRRSAGFFLEE
jgi:hypothetical protein